MTTVGSLCKGIGGLDLAVEEHFGAEPVWYSEIDPAPSTVLERHWPGVPNYGDLKAIDWHAVEPVDILTAGYPCQPFSYAGKRKGTDDPRHLWPYIIEGIRTLRPRLVVLENVRGHLSLGFDTVLGSLAEAGFDAEWCLLRASDVGACHQRARLFIVAADSRRVERQEGWADEADRSDAAGSAGLATRPGEGAATDAHGHGHGPGQDGGGVGRLDGPDAGAPRQRERSRQEPGDRSATSAPDSTSGGNQDEPLGGLALGLPVVAVAGAGDRAGAGAIAEGVHGGRRPAAVVEWGDYEAAIRRHELAFGRPAPAPTDDRGRLNVPFVEWMMGYPEGWVDGLTRTQALKALGNAVVPRQALAALRELCPIEREVAA